MVEIGQKAKIMNNRRWHPLRWAGQSEILRAFALKFDPSTALFIVLGILLSSFVVYLAYHYNSKFPSM